MIITINGRRRELSYQSLPLPLLFESIGIMISDAEIYINNRKVLAQQWLATMVCDGDDILILSIAPSGTRE